MDVITPTIINFISTELVSFESNSGTNLWLYLIKPEP